MDSYTSLDSKRKASEDINDEILHKKITLENNENTTVKQGEDGNQQTSNTCDTSSLGSKSEDEQTFIRFEEESSFGSKNEDSRPQPPADTLIPFDRLIVLIWKQLVMKIRLILQLFK
ncbi:unnamed protein product [Rhizopus stolonifer]